MPAVCQNVCVALGMGEMDRMFMDDGWRDPFSFYKDMEIHGYFQYILLYTTILLYVYE